MKSGKIIILSGPSGSGKTTLYQKILKNSKFRNKIVRSISVTTRPKRPGEKQGVDYIFVSKKMFIYKKRAGHFLESEEVFNNFYGTPNKNVQNLLKSGKHVLLCIDVKGAMSVWRKYRNAVTIFIKTSTFSILKTRLEKRGSEDPKIMKVRLETAKEELLLAKDYQHTVINDHLATAYKNLADILWSEINPK